MDRTAIILATLAIQSFVASLIVALLYWRDKRAARLGLHRTSERTLLIGSILGGWPGGLIAGKVLRHKTQKVSFRVKWFACVIVYLAAIVFVLWLVQ